MPKYILYIFRIADIYVVFKAAVGTVCGSNELHISQVNSLTPSHTPAGASNDNTSESNTTIEQDELLLVAKRMTLISLYYEFAIACLIIFSVFLCIYNCNCCRINWSEWDYKTLKTSVTPFILVDCAVNIIFGPFGNVYFFILGCREAYLTVFFRIGFYLSTISLPAVFSFLHNNKENPELDYDPELKSMVIITLKLALKLLSCSSSLATFIKVAYPEPPIIRYTYLSFTVLIGLSALITYYETLLKLVEVVKSCVESCMVFHSVLNHFTFWPSMLANFGLVGLNAFILYKYFDTGGTLSILITLALNGLSLSFSIPVYVLSAVFCGHGPLYKVCCSRLRASSDSLDQPI